MLRFSCTIVLIINATILAKGQDNIDVLHYKFEIELSNQSDTIKGRALVTVQFLEPSNKFWLNLASPTVNGKGMIAYRVNEDNEMIISSHRHDSLIITLKKTAQKNETRTIEILYQGIPSDGLIISKNKYGDRTFFADNWPNRGHNWIPCHDDPADKATVEFVVTAPEHYQVVANGVQIANYHSSPAIT